MCVPYHALGAASIMSIDLMMLIGVSWLCYGLYELSINVVRMSAGA
ncbi:MAG: hypothetical protein IJ764_04640 [Bacteroidales bacterium]|nr:hypothetical protein [Bacteroidales bacterium]